MRETTYVPGRAARWSSVVAAIVGLVVAGYFLIGSALVKLTFFGDQPTATQQAQSEQLMTLCVVVLFIGTPAAVGIARWCVRSVEQLQPSNAASCAWTLALCGPSAFALALLVIALVPTDARPVAFGILWFVGGAVLFPLLVAASYRRRAATEG
jgi:hypothetical protein